jgi:hypothetical protein
MNEKEDKHLEAENKSSANFFAELLSSNSSKTTHQLNDDFTLYLTIVNFKILHQLLKKMYKNSDRELAIEALPNEIVETWRQNENEIHKTAAKIYEEHCKTDVGKIMKSIMQDPNELLKSQLVAISRAATAFRELMTKKSKLFSFDSLKSGE